MTTALRRIIFIVMIAAIWEVTSRLSVLPEFMFPRLTQVLETLFNGLVSGQMLEAIGKSMSRLLIGFSIAIILGVKPSSEQKQKLVRKLGASTTITSLSEAQLFAAPIREGATMEELRRDRVARIEKLIPTLLNVSEQPALIQ